MINSILYLKDGHFVLPDWIAFFMMLIARHWTQQIYYFSSESDEDLFGESKQTNTFDDESPFSKKGGLFSGGETLFDEVSKVLFSNRQVSIFALQ